MKRMTDHRDTFVVLHANREHTGVRFVVLLVLAIMLVTTFLGFNLIIGSLDSEIASYSSVISCLLAILVALAFGALVEYLLKRNWPSGQTVAFDAAGVEATLKDGQKQAVKWSERFNILKWHFAVKGYARGGRERRVPGSHHCLAIQVQQDDQRFIVHGYLPENELEPLIKGTGYFEIKPSEHAPANFVRQWIGSTDRPKIPTAILAGKEGPYWLAERRRWADGLELERDDLETFISIIDEQYATWDDLGEL